VGWKKGGSKDDLQPIIRRYYLSRSNVRDQRTRKEEGCWRRCHARTQKGVFNVRAKCGTSGQRKRNGNPTGEEALSALSTRQEGGPNRLRACFPSRSRKVVGRVLTAVALNPKLLVQLQKEGGTRWFWKRGGSAREGRRKGGRARRSSLQKGKPLFPPIKQTTRGEY